MFRSPTLLNSLISRYSYTEASECLMQSIVDPYSYNDGKLIMDESSGDYLIDIDVVWNHWICEDWTKPAVPEFLDAGCD